MSKNIYVIVRAKTGKLITENIRLPFFWYKKEADHRAKDFIGAKVVPMKIADLITLLNQQPQTNEQSTK